MWLRPVDVQKSSWREKTIKEVLGCLSMAALAIVLAAPVSAQTLALKGFCRFGTKPRDVQHRTGKGQECIDARIDHTNARMRRQPFPGWRRMMPPPMSPGASSYSPLPDCSGITFKTAISSLPGLERRNE
jgi:hypothetical protein